MRRSLFAMDRSVLLRRGAGVIGVAAIIGVGLLTERLTRQAPPR